MKKILLISLIIVGAISNTYGQPIPSSVRRFLRLFDTPSTYSGQAGKVVTVNSGETALEFTSGSGGTTTFVGLTDTPSDYTGDGGKYLKVNAGATAVEFVTLSGGGDLLADGTVPMTANWDIGNFDLTLKALTGDGTIEGATLTEGGNAVYSSGETPGGELGGTFASFTIDDSVTVTGWVLGTSSATQLTSPTVIVNLIDTTGAADIDYGSADVTDHTFLSDGTGTGEFVLKAGAIDATEVLDNTLDFADLSDTMTLDATTTISSGAYGLEIIVANPTASGFEINGTGAFVNDLLHVHQHTGNPTGGTLAAFESVDTDITPQVHIHQDKADITAAVVSFLIDCVDTADSDWTPFEIRDTSDGANNLLFSVDYQGSIITATPKTLIAAELDRLDGLAGIIATDATAVTDLEGTGLSIGGATLNWSAASTDLTDTADILYEAELDSFAELDAQIADKALINLEDGGTFTGNIIANANLSIGNTTTTAGVLTLLEDDDDGANFASFMVPALGANTVYILPPDDGDNTEVLQTNGTGTLTWVANAGGGAVAWDDIGDPDAAATVDFVTYTQTIDIGKSDSGGGDGLILTATGLGAGADTVDVLKITTTANDDSDYRPIIVMDDSGGTPDVLFTVNYDGSIYLDDRIIFVYSGLFDQSANNYFTFEDNGDTLEVYFDGTDVGLIYSDGVLKIRNAEDGIDGIVDIAGKDAGEKGILRILSDGDDKATTMYHDDTDGQVGTTSGDLYLTAAGGDINFADDNTTTTGSATAATLILTGADASPAAAGNVKYDSTVAGMSGGALRWYDDNSVRLIVDLETDPSNDDYVVAYDAAADGFYMLAAGAGDMLRSTYDSGESGGVDQLTTVDSTYASDYVMLIGTAVGTDAPKTDGGLTYDATSGTLDSTLMTKGGQAMYDADDVPGGQLGGTFASFTVDDLFIKLGGDTVTAGTYDFTAATLTMPKRTSNDDRFYAFNVWNPNSVYDTDTQICIEPNLPANITITEVTVTCDADPATELDWDLKWADAFIGLGNAALIEPIDTTNGTTDIDSGFDDATVVAGKCLYIEFGADPDSNIKQAMVKIRYDYD